MEGLFFELTCEASGASRREPLACWVDVIVINHRRKLLPGEASGALACVCPAWVRTRRGSSPLCEIECIMKYPFNEVVIRSTSRSQLRKVDRPWEGRLGDSHEPMNKNLIRGRQSEVSWHNTAKPSDSALEVSEAVVWRRFVRLPGEISVARGRESDSAVRSNALGDDREVDRQFHFLCERVSPKKEESRPSFCPWQME
jgi:hypothetical protein